MKKLYVGGLPFETTEEELQKLFEEHKLSPSEVVIIRDKFSGRSKGFGFVTIEDDALAQSAIEKLNGTQVGGRNITVNEARPMEKRSGGFGRGGRRGGGGFDKGSGKGNRW